MAPRSFALETRMNAILRLCSSGPPDGHREGRAALQKQLMQFCRKPMRRLADC